MLSSTLILTCAIGCVAAGALAADLYIVEADGSREEKIDGFSVRGFERGQGEVHLRTATASCRIRLKSLSEAKRLKERLVQDEGSSIQCFGGVKIDADSGTAAIETASFSLGQKVAAKQVVTDQ